jgi:hypothetical protein
MSYCERASQRHPGRQGASHLGPPLADHSGEPHNPTTPQPYNPTTLQPYNPVLCTVFKDCQILAKIPVKCSISQIDLKSEKNLKIFQVSESNQVLTKCFWLGKILRFS